MLDLSRLSKNPAPWGSEQRFALNGYPGAARHSYLTALSIVDIAANLVNPSNLVLASRRPFRLERGGPARILDNLSGPQYNLPNGPEANRR